MKLLISRIFKFSEGSDLYVLYILPFKHVFLPGHRDMPV